VARLSAEAHHQRPVAFRQIRIPKSPTTSYF
jgi:hypothetical protein